MQQDLTARAQRALQRIIDRPLIQAEQRYWHAEPEDDSAPTSSVLSRANPEPYQASPPSSPSSYSSLLNPYGQIRQTQTALQPPFQPGQTVLIKDRQLAWNKQNLFAVQSIYTRHLRTMTKVPWTPQSIFPVVELRQGVGNGVEVLVVPLKRVVGLPEYLESGKRRMRERCYAYRAVRGAEGKRKVLGEMERRYVSRFLGVWAEEVKGREEGEVWVLVEWVEGDVEKFLARELRVANRGRWERDLGGWRVLEEERGLGDSDEGGVGLNEGFEAEAAGGDEDAGGDSVGEEDAESFETEYEYRHVLREFKLEQTRVRGGCGR